MIPGPNVWLGLNDKFPAVTPEIGAKVVFASALPGTRHLAIIAVQADGRYSVERINQLSTVYTSPWVTLSRLPDCTLAQALGEANKMIMSAYGVTIRLSDAADRLAASTTNVIAGAPALPEG